MATRGGSGSTGGKFLTGQGTGGGSQTGSNWTNLSQYLDANKGAGAGMADDITKNTQKEVERIDNQGGAVDTWETDAKKQVDSKTRQDTYSGVIKNGSSKEVAGIDKGAYSAWKDLGNYYGAKDSSQTQGYDQVYKDVNNTKDQIKNLNSYDGQKAALQNSYGKAGNYGKGFQSLDAFALNGDASGQQKLQSFQTQNANFGQKFDQANTGVNNHISGAADRGKAVMDRTNTAINDRATGYRTPAQQAAQNDEGGYGAQVDAVNKKYQESGLAPIGQRSGISGQSVDMASQYVTKNAGDASAYMEDVDRDAYNSLAGIDEDANTVALERGNKASATTDWESILADIASKQPKVYEATPTDGNTGTDAENYRRKYNNT